MKNLRRNFEEPREPSPRTTGVPGARGEGEEGHQGPRRPAQGHGDGVEGARPARELPHSYDGKQFEDYLPTRMMVHPTRTILHPTRMMVHRFFSFRCKQYLRFLFCFLLGGWGEGGCFIGLLVPLSLALL